MWEKWIQSFAVFAMGKCVDDDNQKNALLLHCTGHEVQDIFYTLPAGAGDTAYVDALTKYFKGKVNRPYERYCFRMITQGDDTVEQFITRLKQQSRMWEFTNSDEQLETKLSRSVDLTNYGHVC